VERKKEWYTRSLFETQVLISSVAQRLGKLLQPKVTICLLLSEVVGHAAKSGVLLQLRGLYDLLADAAEHLALLNLGFHLLLLFLLLGKWSKEPKELAPNILVFGLSEKHQQCW